MEGQDSSSGRSFYKVGCEFQLRFRIITDDELRDFKSFAMRPSPYSALKNEIEGQLGAMTIRDESKNLLEKAFQILLNIDQRLERIEEHMHELQSGKPSVLENYDWVNGEVGAGGFTFIPEKPKSLQVGNLLLLDAILPSLPEQRMVAVGRVDRLEGDKVETSFEAVHDDDIEFLHRFVITRERELLRARAQEREKQKPD